MPVQKGKYTARVAAEYFWSNFNRKPLDHSDEQNVNGKTVVITGANSGIGEVAAFEFAKRGAVVVMACRDVHKAENVKQSIKTKYPDAKLELLKLDLGDLSSVRACAQEIRKNHNKIDILVNNAGFTAYTKELSKTKDGFEAHMGVNHLGHFLFTHLLLDLVKNAAPSRILFTNSMCFQMGELDPNDFMLEKRGNFADLSFHFGAYANSKLAINYCVKILAKKLANTGVNVYSLCPGYVDTGFQEKGGMLLWAMTKTSANKPSDGAENILYCALMKSIENQSGQMYRSNSLWESAMEDLDDDIGQQVWEKSLEYLKISEF